MRKWTLEDVADHWDSTAEYDEVNSRIDSYRRRFTDSEPLFSLPPEARVLDVDCRTGNGTVYFSSRNPTAEFVCVAMAPSFRERARQRLDSNDIDAPVSLFEQLPLPFDDDSFDVVLTFETIEHVPWPDRFVEELSRLLKSGGTLVLTTPNRLWDPVHRIADALGLDHGEGPHKMLSRNTLHRLFSRHGFEIEVERTFVLVPAGPEPVVRIGKAIEKHLPERLRRYLCLRRTFVCEKT
jgi:SAM-dependent methyltransferase